MRRKNFLLLLLTGLFFLTACGGAQAGPAASEQPPECGEEPTVPVFQAQYIRTNGGRDKTAYPYAAVIRSREELDAYYDTNKTVYDLARKEKIYSDTTIGFLDACDGYDKAFFEEHDLIFAVLEEGSGSIRHEVTEVRRNGETDGWQVVVKAITPECGTCDMAQWHLMIELPKGTVGEGEKVSVVYEGQTQLVQYSHGYVNMALALPENWTYEITEWKQEGDFFGIRFWPSAAEKGAVSLYYHPAFGVCGTGLKSEEYLFDNGLKGSMGTYDGRPVWDFIVFEDLPGTYVAKTEGADAWWGEYGEQAMEVLGAARLSEGVMTRSEAIVMAEKQCDIVEHDDVWKKFNIENGEWTLEFRKRGAAEPAQTIRLAPDGSVVKKP